MRVSEQSRQLLIMALQSEVNNGLFYYRCMKAAQEPYIEGVFHYLWHVERQHQPVFFRLVGDRMPHGQPGEVEPGANEHESLRLAIIKENWARHFYAHTARVAVEPRVREVFEALAEVESDHLNLEELLVAVPSDDRLAHT